MEYFPSEFTIVVGMLFVLEVVLGVVFNLYVIWKRINTKPKRSSTDGRNFIAALNATDILVSVTTIPLTLVALIANKRSNTTLCLLKESLVMLASAGSSFSVLLISMDRYCAVVLPTRRFFTKTRVKKCKILLFTLTCIGFILPSVSLIPDNFHNSTATYDKAVPCRGVLWNHLPYYIYELYYIISFVTTLIFVFLTYGSVLKVVRRRLEVRLNAASTSSEAGFERLRQQEMKATRVSYGVVITYLICWGPHATITIIQLTLPQDLLVDLLQYICLCAAFSVVVFHPLIYSHSDPTNQDTSGGARLNIMSSINRIIPLQSKRYSCPNTSTNQPPRPVSQLGTSSMFHVSTSSSKSLPSNEHTV